MKIAAVTMLFLLVGCSRQQQPIAMKTHSFRLSDLSVQSNENLVPGCRATFSYQNGDKIVGGLRIVAISSDYRVLTTELPEAEEGEILEADKNGSLSIATYCR
jgi:hypothetical protein